MSSMTPKKRKWKKALLFLFFLSSIWGAHVVTFYFDIEDGGGSPERVVIKHGIPYSYFSRSPRVIIDTGFVKNQFDPTAWKKIKNGSTFRIWHRNGYEKWGEELASKLKPAEQGLTFYRLGEEERAVTTLVSTLTDRSLHFFLRESAVLALGKIGRNEPERVREFLLTATKDENSFVRGAAALALGDIAPASPESVIPPLLEALKDPEAHVRGPAAQVLDEIGLTRPDLVIPPLLEALQDTRAYVRQWATSVLAQVGKKQPDQVIPRLLALQEEDPTLKGGVIRALVRISAEKPEGLLPVVRKALLDPHPFVKKVAISSFAEIGPNHPEVFKLLLESANDPDPSVREEAIRALGRLGPQQAGAILPVLLAAAEDSEKSVRQEAVRALGSVGRIDPIRVLPLLFNARKDEKNPFLRKAAIEALGELGGETSHLVIPALTMSLWDTDTIVQWAAARELVKAGPHSPDQVLPHLFTSLKDQNPSVRGVAARVLGRLGEIQPDPVIEGLLTALNDPIPFVRGSVVRALGIVGGNRPHEVMPALLSAMSDQDRFTRTEAQKAVARLLARRAVEQKEEPPLTFLMERLTSLEADANSQYRSTVGEAIVRFAQHSQEYREETRDLLSRMRRRDRRPHIRIAASLILEELSYPPAPDDEL